MKIGRRQQNIEHPFLDVLLGPRQNFFKRRLFCHIDADIGEFAHHAFDIATDVANLGKF